MPGQQMGGSNFDMMSYAPPSGGNRSPLTTPPPPMNPAFVNYQTAAQAEQAAQAYEMYQQSQTGGVGGQTIGVEYQPPLGRQMGPPLLGPETDYSVIKPPLGRQMGQSDYSGGLGRQMGQQPAMGGPQQMGQQAYQQYMQQAQQPPMGGLGQQMGQSDYSGGPSRQMGQPDYRSSRYSYDRPMFGGGGRNSGGGLGSLSSLGGIGRQMGQPDYSGGLGGMRGADGGNAMARQFNRRSRYGD